MDEGAIRRWERRTYAVTSQTVWEAIGKAGFTPTFLYDILGVQAYSVPHRFARWGIEQMRPYMSVEDEVGDASLFIRVGGKAHISGDPLTLLLDLPSLVFCIFGLQLLHPGLQATPLQKFGLHFSLHLTKEQDLMVQWFPVHSRDWIPVRFKVSSLYDPAPPYEEEIRISQPIGSHIFKLPVELWPPSLYLTFLAI